MQNVFGFSHATFDRFTKPTLYNCARCVNFLDFNLRLWDYNHTCTVGRSVGRSSVRPSVRPSPSVHGRPLSAQADTY